MYYCETASQLDRSDLLEIVVDELKTEDSPLLEAIEEAINYPYEPGPPQKSTPRMPSGSARPSSPSLRASWMTR
jgi:hypothetical protein